EARRPACRGRSDEESDDRTSVGPSPRGTQRERVISPRSPAVNRPPLQVESPLHEIARIVAGGNDWDADFPFNDLDRQIIQESIIVPYHRFGRQHGEIAVNISF